MDMCFATNYRGGSRQPVDPPQRFLRCLHSLTHRRCVRPVPSQACLHSLDSCRHSCRQSFGRSVVEVVDDVLTEALVVVVDVLVVLDVVVLDVLVVVGRIVEVVVVVVLLVVVVGT